MAFYAKNYDLFLVSTQSFCHLCGNLNHLVDTHIITKDNEVFLRKFCPKCGESMVKISTDLAYFNQCNDYIKQPDLPEQPLTKVLRGCPYDCGVCPQHQNHPCLALFNITDECNMKCNICYYSSEPGLGNHRSMVEIEQMLATLLKTESEPDLIQVTGGEPTTHPEIIEILHYLKKSPVRHLMLNTNGIRIASDEAFVKKLKKLGGGFEVYLQFDSLSSDVLKDIRNQDMTKIRQQALAMLEKHNISTTLVSVIKKGVNEQEIPDIIEFSRAYRCVRGVVFQPVQEAGRIHAHDDFRITLSEIRQTIIKDKTNPFNSEDMIPLPCDPHKIGVGYAAKTMSVDENGKPYANLMPVTGQIPKEMITKQKGTVSFEQDRKFVKTVVETVSLDTAMGEGILRDKIKQKLFCCWPSFLTPENMGYENVYRIVIMEFSDMVNFDSTNIKRECNFMIEPNRVIPFSTYNMGIKFSQ
ncbi:MAG: radical SAM protein [Epsilonproteobacteria bacterium]|nr:radical SAM protein [Campylobacterota bacterium]